MELCREWREWWNCNVALFEQQFLYKKDFELKLVNLITIWYVNPYITNYHGFSGSTQHTFIISQLLWVRVWAGPSWFLCSGSHKTETKVLTMCSYQKNWLRNSIQVLTKFIPLWLVDWGPVFPGCLLEDAQAQQAACHFLPRGASKSVTYNMAIYFFNAICWLSLTPVY